MTRHEYLLECLAEEASEVIQRCMKALRFGPDQIQRGYKLNNADRIREEINDFMTLVEMCELEGVLTPQEDEDVVIHAREKCAKVNYYYDMMMTGTLATEPVVETEK